MDDVSLWMGRKRKSGKGAGYLDKKATLEHILSQAVLSSFDPAYYSDRQTWQREMDQKEVRMQWDPDHDPYGDKLTRRAIQLGLKGEVLRDFGRQSICAIEDVTEFVKAQKVIVDSRQLELLEVPAEAAWMPADEILRKRIGIDML